MEQTVEDKVNEALDTIESAVADVRTILEAEPVRDLAAEVKTALETFVSTVSDAITKASEALDRESMGDTPGDEGGPEEEPAP